MNLWHIPPLLAVDIGQIIVALVPIIASLAYYLINAMSNDPTARKQPRPPGGAPQRPAVAPPQREAQAQRDREAQLQAAKERRARKKGGKVLQAEIVPQRPAKPQQPPPRKAPLAQQRPSDPPRKTRLEEQRLEPREIDERTRRLGEGVQAELADMTADVAASFQGSLAAVPDNSATTPSDAPHPPAPDWANLFANPANVRQAILLQEILRRPDERW